ncbi:UvrB/UvrC motif-containing protein, partial [Candidatus Saccharibacteria bacterium]|nr:UvrB/UvrC motif-containing protein [Candidatus Saccharibacteria bacterium]
LGLEPNIENGTDDYKKDLRKLISYIKGNRVAVIKEIEADMKAAAKAQNFELAAHRRNQLASLNELRRQVVFSREEFLDASKDQALIGLRDLLNLPHLPRRIEAYDISHISGTNVVASMVVVTNGVADKREYRKFKLSGGNDDYAGLREIMVRRLKHLSDWGRPDLVIIDGGAGQLGAVADLLRAEDIPFIGRNKSGDHSRNARVKLILASSVLAKPKTAAPAGTVPARSASSYHEILLSGDDHIARLIARLDDEAHRFAVTYHQLLRGKTMMNRE